MSPVFFFVLLCCWTLECSISQSRGEELRVRVVNCTRCRWTRVGISFGMINLGIELEMLFGIRNQESEFRFSQVLY